MKKIVLAVMAVMLVAGSALASDVLIRTPLVTKDKAGSFISPINLDAVEVYRETGYPIEYRDSDTGTDVVVYKKSSNQESEIRSQNRDIKDIFDGPIRIITIGDKRGPVIDVIAFEMLMGYKKAGYPITYVTLEDGGTDAIVLRKQIGLDKGTCRMVVSSGKSRFEQICPYDKKVVTKIYESLADKAKKAKPNTPALDFIPIKALNSFDNIEVSCSGHGRTETMRYPIEKKQIDEKALTYYTDNLDPNKLMPGDADQVWLADVHIGDIVVSTPTFTDDIHLENTIKTVLTHNKGSIQKVKLYTEWGDVGTDWEIIFDSPRTLVPEHQEELK